MSAASCPALVWAIPLPSGCGTGGRACENLPCASETECVPGHEFPAKGIDGFHDSRRMRELGGLYLPCDSHMEPADPWRSAPMTCLPPLFALPKEALASLAQNKRGHAPSASTGMAAFSVCFFRPLGGVPYTVMLRTHFPRLSTTRAGMTFRFISSVVRVSARVRGITPTPSQPMSREAGTGTSHM